MCANTTRIICTKAADGIGKRLQEWITLAKQAGLGTEDIREMLEGLL